MYTYCRQNHLRMTGRGKKGRAAMDKYITRESTSPFASGGRIYRSPNNDEHEGGGGKETWGLGYVNDLLTEIRELRKENKSIQEQLHENEGESGGRKWKE